MGEEIIYLKCVSTPNNDLAQTNRVYYSDSQFPNRKVHYILIQGKNKSLVLAAEPHPDVQDNCIALNRIHRTELRLSLNVTDVECSIFSPPSKDFLMEKIVIEIDLLQTLAKLQSEVDAVELDEHIKSTFVGQVFTVDQKFAFQFEGATYIGVVSDLENFVNSDIGEMQGNEKETRGMLDNKSSIVFVKAKGSNLKLVNISQPSTRTTNILKTGASFEKMGIGGLDIQLGKMFRRAFASRVYPPDIIKKLGIKHVKGILLYGPPGCGKTLMARQIGKLLNSKEPKVVNGPEILNKYVGESEANIRALFEDAEREYAEKGDDSELHLIIFDEIDAICKQRGTVNSGTGVNDSVVNQLLSKIDGVNSLNNVLLIGMTNRMDMIDEALLRPGRFEVQTEIGLPDEQGRIQILNIHTTGMKTSKALGDDVDIDYLAMRTKNFSGAELEGLVKSAASFALNRHIDIEKMDSIPSDIGDKIKVTGSDFERALEEVKPAFGISTDEIDAIISQGIINYGDDFSRLKGTLESFVNQVRVSKNTNVLSVLLEGKQGAGKTCLAATIAKESEFPYIKIISPQSMVGFSETMKCNRLTKTFDDAYKSPFSIIVLDDIERLVDFVNIGPRFSNSVLQTLLVLVKKAPPKGRKLFIIATTSRRDVLESLELIESFNVTCRVPTLDTESNIENVLSSCEIFKNDRKLASTYASLVPTGISIKKLLLVVDMVSSRVSEDDKLTTSLFNEALSNVGVF